MCEGENQDGTTTKVACENVVSRELVAVATCPESETCEGPSTGILTDDADDDDGFNDYAAEGDDFDFAAAFLAAADKTGDIGVDMVVYLNLILGINKVLGYSEYDEDGNPTEDAVNYSEEPEYFNFGGIGDQDENKYNRNGTFGIKKGDPERLEGYVRVLQGGNGSWTEEDYWIMDLQFQLDIGFHNIGIDPEDGFPNGDMADSDIRGFAQMADDDLSVIGFVHTYQIPGLR